MTDKLLAILSPLNGMICGKASISSRGALQLGFGKSTKKKLLNGRLEKDEFEWEVGCFDSNWRYVSLDGTIISPGELERKIQNFDLLLGIKLNSAAFNKPNQMVLSFENGKIQFSMPSGDDCIYIYGPSEISIMLPSDMHVEPA